MPELDKAATPAFMQAYGASMIPATGRALRIRYEEGRRCVAIER